VTRSKFQPVEDVDLFSDRYRWPQDRVLSRYSSLSCSLRLQIQKARRVILQLTAIGRKGDDELHCSIRSGDTRQDVQERLTFPTVRDAEIALLAFSASIKWVGLGGLELNRELGLEIAFEAVGADAVRRLEREEGPASPPSAPFSSAGRPRLDEECRNDRWTPIRRG
jgi:hypothetical protein